MLRDDVGQIAQPAFACLPEAVGQIAQVDSKPRGPNGEDEGLLRQVLPCSAKIKLMVESPRLPRDDLVADEEHGIDVAVLSGPIDELRPNSKLFRQHDPSQGNRRAAL